MKLALLLLALSPLGAVEIATGKMLGAGYDARSFYVREGAGPWRKTYSGPRFRPEAGGKLMNLRLAQAITHDEWLTEEPFDPMKNTARAIAALDVYKSHGILCISTSLQGGNQQYDLTPNIKRTRLAKLGPGKGALMSAFRPDGSLKPEWMARALRLARELDKRGMALTLLYFYGYQDEVLESPAAIDRAVREATDWIIDNNLRNVIIEVANEHDGGDYDHGRYIDTHIGGLIRMAQQRFVERKAGWRAPVSASTTGDRGMLAYDRVREVADLTILHGNHQTPEDKARFIAAAYTDAKLPGPIHVNEDNNGRDTTPENLARELASCDAVFRNGGGWGYMPWRQAQIHPFRSYAPAVSSRITPEMPVLERDLAYFKAVLEHVKGLVFRP